MASTVRQIDVQASNTYLPALDGLRALAVMLVVVAHAGYQAQVPGGLGVTIFFVLSGFLLTRQMIAEIEKTKTLNVKNFYLRRFFRLAPALLFYIFITSTILMGLGYTPPIGTIASGLFYFANYYKVFISYPLHSAMPILWSLSVEEHFYILFPLTLLLFRKNLSRAGWYLAATASAALIWRLTLFNMCDSYGWSLCGLPGKERFYRTDTIFDCILYGCLAAFFLNYAKAEFLPKLINPIAFALAAAGLLFCLLYRDLYFRDTFRFTLESFSIAVAMMNILFGKWAMPRQILSHPVLVVIGHLSYALYMFHYGALVFLNALKDRGMLSLTPALHLLVYLTLSFAMAAICYYGIEKPMISFRKRYGAKAYD